MAVGATGAWTGKDGCVAAWTTGGWRFIVPAAGLALLDRANATTSAYRNGEWELGIVRANAVRIGVDQVVGPRQPAIAAPAGGSNVDAEARLAIESVLAAMRAHGLIA